MKIFRRKMIHCLHNRSIPLRMNSFLHVVSVAECSTAATVALSSTTDVVTNPSAEDTTTIANEKADSEPKP